MKKAISIFTLLLLISPIFSATAIAVSDTAAQTTVSVSFSGLVDNQGEQSESYSYEINIPVSYDITAEEYMAITAQNVSIGDGKRVAVYLDGEKTLNDSGVFELFHSAGPEYRAEGRIIRTTDPDFGARNRIDTPEDVLVATFLDGEETSGEYGYIIVLSDIVHGGKNGTYTGTLYFKIAVEDI